MTNIPTTHGLDLSPLLALRAPAAALLERLKVGETAALPAALALLDQEDAIGKSALRVLVELGVDDRRTQDALGEVVSEIGTGDLGYWTDVAAGRIEHVEAGS